MCMKLVEIFKTNIWIKWSGVRILLVLYLIYILPTGIEIIYYLLFNLV